MHLWAASSALDTDFTAKLIDVYPPSEEHPEGLAVNITDSILRARYRNSYEKPELLTPGEVYEFVFQLYPTSNVFKAGHRIRLDVSSSNWPRFDVNPNTGGPLGLEQRRGLVRSTTPCSTSLQSQRGSSIIRGSARNSARYRRVAAVVGASGVPQLVSSTPMGPPDEQLAEIESPWMHGA